jgi:hypothetical protein
MARLSLLSTSHYTTPPTGRCRSFCMCWPCYGSARLCKGRKTGREVIPGAAAVARKEGRRPPRHRHREQQPAPSRCAHAPKEFMGASKRKGSGVVLPWAAAKLFSIWASNAIAIYAGCTVLYPPKDKDTSVQKLTLPAEAPLELRAPPRLPPTFPIPTIFKAPNSQKKQPNSGCQACVLAFGTIKYKLMQTAKCNCTEESRAQLT